LGTYTKEQSRGGVEINILDNEFEDRMREAKNKRIDMSIPLFYASENGNISNFCLNQIDSIAIAFRKRESALGREEGEELELEDFKFYFSSVL
jgi:hypothetical protein